MLERSWDIVYIILFEIYCDESCIKGKSDIPSTFTFIYKSAQNTCLLIEVWRKGES